MAAHRFASPPLLIFNKPAAWQPGKPLNLLFFFKGKGIACLPVHQVGVRLIGGVGTTGTMAGGITWDSKGNIGLYGSAGSGTGVDGSLGVEYVNNTSYCSDFNIKSLRGTSADNNAGVGIPLIGLDHSTGGNAIRNTLFTQTGNQYKSNAIGVSVSPFAVGGSRTFENMGIVKLFNVK